MYRYTNAVTPAEINDILETLIHDLVPNEKPIYIDVKPNNNFAINVCFDLVKEQVSTNGGRQINGWTLWELPTLYCEAEFHCIWEDKNGLLTDVTPKSNKANKILFLPDTNLEYENMQKNNVRRKIKNIQVLDDWFETFYQEFLLLNKGERATQYGEIILKDDEASEMENIYTKCK